MYNIAIVAGGDSSEHEVSLRSAAGIVSWIDRELFNPAVVVIKGASWKVQLSETEVVDIDKNDFSYTANGEKTTFDFAYITIHGTPGENGLLQGYLDMLHIPYSCCSVLAAALTFNKFTCNHYLSNFGINISPSVLLRKGDTISDDAVVNAVGLPCFIKSNVGGSSFGCTKVKTADQIQDAINKAFAEGDEVVIEAFMKGVEVTSGAYKTKSKAIAFPITEVVTHNEFFDYDAKYKGQVEEITPARLSADLTKRIQDMTLRIYDIVGCSGIIRIDYIITDGDKINLLEINTTPGMTATSFIPQQVRAAGLEMKEVLTDIIMNKLQ